MTERSRPMLFLVVDAVPHDVVRELWEAGEMPGFAEPRPVVSVFPSLTNVAVPALVRGVVDVRPPGYEARYFHPPSGEVRGGLGDRAADIAFSAFRNAPRTSFAHVVIYVFSDAITYSQVRWVGYRFREHGGPWLGYISATDGVAHFQGRDALLDAVRDVFGQVREVLDRCEREVGVRPGAVLCSDHGFHFGPLEVTESVAFERLLEVAGFRPGRFGPRGVLLAPVGEVAGGAAWCRLDEATAVAEVIAEVPGVDIAFGRVSDGCEVFAVRDRLERAHIRWKEGATLYEPVDGDPLGYGPLWDRLGGGWVDDRTLFDASWDHPYPYATARVRQGFTDLVRWPAQVLFSMADGAAVSPPLTHAASRIRGGQVGTHGSLSRAQSTGFAAATEPGWSRPGALLPEEVFAPWRELVRQGALAPG